MGFATFFRWRRSREADLEDEIQSHLRMAVRDRMDRGVSAADASGSAKREFGNVGLVKEVTRQMWGWTSVERLLQDVRYAGRVLRKNRGFTAVAVLSVALGVGANTAIFTVIDAVMLKSLPVRNPNELVIVGNPTWTSGVSAGGPLIDEFSYPFYERFRQENRVFRDVYATGRCEQLNILFPDASSTGSTEQKPRGRFVTGNFFSVLGVPAAMGRTFTEKEVAAPGSDPVVVISYGYWERQFAREPTIIGRKVNVNGSGFTIIGVTPRSFFGDIVGAPADLWFPVTMQAQANPGHDYLKDKQTSWLLLMGRLKPGVSLAQANAAVNVTATHIFSDLYKNESPESLRRLLKEKFSVSSGARGFSRLRVGFSLPLLTLMGIVGLILLICCGNVANLQLARAVSRTREMGLRMAVGAGRARIVRQLLTESLALSLGGGAAGLLLAFWGSRVLVRLVSQAAPVRLDLQLDSRVLLFTFLLSLFAGLLFGLTPAWNTTRLDVVSSLKESKSGQPDGFSRAFGKLLIVSQIVLSLVLLVGAGLFIRTLQNLEKVDVGYARNGLLLVELDPRGGGYSDAKVNQATRQLTERLQRIPGVQEITFSENGLFSGTESDSSVDVEGYTPPTPQDKEDAYDRIGPGYFTTIGALLIQGRGIGVQDTEQTAKVTVINEKMARFYFPRTNPIGHHIFEGTGKDRIAFTIVGVVRDVKQSALREPASRRFYKAFLQHADSDPIEVINFEIRTAMPSSDISAEVRRAIRDFNSSLPISKIETADALIDDTLIQEHLIAKLSAFFGILALVLAAIGLYGVMSYMTARRTMEIGIRFALGAAKTTVMSMVLKDTLQLVAIGLAIGILASALTAKLFAKSLFGLSAFDPLTSILAACVITVAAGIAAYLPAWRAARVDPLIALRYE